MGWAWVLCGQGASVFLPEGPGALEKAHLTEVSS